MRLPPSTEISGLSPEISEAFLKPMKRNNVTQIRGYSKEPERVDLHSHCVWPCTYKDLPHITSVETFYFLRCVLGKDPYVSLHIFFSTFYDTFCFWLQMIARIIAQIKSVRS